MDVLQYALCLLALWSPSTRVQRLSTSGCQIAYFICHHPISKRTPFSHHTQTSFKFHHQWNHFDILILQRDTILWFAAQYSITPLHTLPNKNILHSIKLNLKKKRKIPKYFKNKMFVKFNELIFVNCDFIYFKSQIWLKSYSEFFYIENIKNQD